MKKYLIAALAAAVILLSGAGYWFNKHYIILSEQDVRALQMEFVQSQYKAFQAGRQFCNSST